MVEHAQADDSRTEAPTEKRLDRAREQGDLAISRELGSAVTLAAITALFILNGRTQILTLKTELASFLLMISSRSPDLAGQLQHGSFIALKNTIVVSAVVLVVGAGTTFLQTRLNVSAVLLRPRWDRLSLRQGFRRMVNLESFIELMRTLCKLLSCTGAVLLAVQHQIPLVLSSEARGFEAIPQISWMLMLRIVLSILLSAIVFASVDFTIVKFRHLRRLKMSKQDIREELKDAEGDPKLKGRVRSIRVMRARRRLAANVTSATVVITNPTHYAVALGYERGKSVAPIVLAKGVDSMALRIREIATGAGVPLVANPVLARALYRVPLDAPIPPEHYQTVATVIAYVWKMARQA